MEAGDEGIMIARLFGELIETTEDSCIVVCAGVGYELNCSLSTLAELQNLKNKQVNFFVHTHVREDALQLFGFLSSFEKTTFLSLLKVNGIGPKSAINILSGANADQLAQMIESEDVKSLSKLPKVGKKTAEQMILALKGKLVLSTDDKAGKKSVRAASTAGSQVSSALINLGFRAQDVEKVVADLELTSVEEGIRQGLAALTNL
jgi:Holliday junction DNA helicase RuvA